MTATVVAFVSGFIALSYEILWYRAYSIAMTSRAQAFGMLLGGYLLGVAAGALISGIGSSENSTRERTLRRLALGVLCANILGYLFVPMLGWLVTTSDPWLPATLLLAITAAGLGATFPLVSQLAIPTLLLVGPRISYVYLANIIGSASGSLLTGLFLVEHLSLSETTAAISLLGLGCAGALFVASARERKRWQVIAGAALLVPLGAVMILLSPSLFARVYDQLHFKRAYTSETHFARIVENRAGVIAVTPDGTVYGSGLYDGVFSTDLRDDRNGIYRAYAVGALHPAPQDVLMIGLSTGSWTTVVSNHSLVERVQVVEINPGYLRLLPSYAAVARLTTDPKVQIEIGDGRRWLQQHADAKFDVIIGNTTFNWRANATSLLSVEFLQLVRAHLNPGGVYYYNTTSEPRVQRTGAVVFPYAWRVNNMLAVSDAPFVPDLDRFREQLSGYRLNADAVLDLNRRTDRELLERIVVGLREDVEPRAGILSRTDSLELITDDNMGVEWTFRRGLRR